jgi:cytochrome bd-type quinol oxidase subunit 1
MRIIRQIFGITFLIAYEILFIWFLILCIQDMQQNHDAYEAYKKAHKSYQQNHDDTSFFIEEANISGYDNYQDYLFYALISAIFLAWPWIILLVLLCYYRVGRQPQVPAKLQEDMLNNSQEIQYVEV